MLSCVGTRARAAPRKIWALRAGMGLVLCAARASAVRAPRSAKCGQKRAGARLVGANGTRARLGGASGARAAGRRARAAQREMCVLARWRWAKRG